MTYRADGFVRAPRGNGVVHLANGVDFITCGVQVLNWLAQTAITSGNKIAVHQLDGGVVEFALIDDPNTPEDESFIVARMERIDGE